MVLRCDPSQRRCAGWGLGLGLGIGKTLWRVVNVRGKNLSIIVPQSNWNLRFLKFSWSDNSKAWKEMNLDKKGKRGGKGVGAYHIL